MPVSVSTPASASRHLRSSRLSGPARRFASGTHQAVVREFVADSGEEEDKSGQRQDRRVGNPLRLQDRSGAENCRHQRGSGEHAEAGTAREHGDHDPEVAEVVRDAALDAVGRSGHLEHARYPCDAAGNE